ncbi:MAG TPA: hypothetical protein VFQ53_40550 [Kofleriaceae bacterium]|nr:hypothetical protein [Kofleriaceae bacterium]
MAIVASEHGPNGVRLVAIDEHGDRQFELIEPATTKVRDQNPAVSPDGRWIVFASSRDRAFDTTSLWIAAVGVEVTPARLTTGDWIDTQPVWTPDGSAIVLASTRDGGDFDLWRLAIRDGRPGSVEQLTHGADHEVTPTIAPDGTILYASVQADPTARGVRSRLEQRAPDGTIQVLTSGPADTSPAFSPDGRSIVFARPAQHGDSMQTELWKMARGSELATQLVVLPITEESGPVWSRDGRFVFATSLLRGDADRPLFSSIVHVDLREDPPHARMLGERAGPVSRLTPAVSTTRLDVQALRSDPEYLPELARIMAAKIADEQAQQ